MNNPESIVERLTIMSEIGPTGVSFRHGVSLAVLQCVDVLADYPDLQFLTTEEAQRVIQEYWEMGSYDLIQDPELAVEVFCFAMVFGEDVAGWLLHEAGTAKVDKSYEMRQPDPEFGWGDVALSKVGRVLPSFRMLQASYIGWLNAA